MSKYKYHGQVAKSTHRYICSCFYLYKFYSPQVMRFKLDAFICDIKREIQLQFGYKEGQHFKIVYNNIELKSGKKLSDYNDFEKEKKKWSKPYAGVIWITLRHIEAPKTSTFYYS